MVNCSSKKDVAQVASAQEGGQADEEFAKIDALAQQDAQHRPAEAAPDSPAGAATNGEARQGNVVGRLAAPSSVTGAGAVDGADAPLPPGKRIVFVLGGPGSGKGTQCSMLHQRFGFEHMSAGDLLREEVASGSPLAAQLTEAMKQGQLVPDDVIIGLLRRALLKADASVCLVDGFPRALEQARKLCASASPDCMPHGGGVMIKPAAAHAAQRVAKNFEEQVAPPAAVLLFETTDDTMQKRILERAKRSGRLDDTEEVIAKRLRVFHEQTEPVKGYYEQRGILHAIDAGPSADEVFKQVTTLAEQLLAAESPEAPAASQDAAASSSVGAVASAAAAPAATAPPQSEAPAARPSPGAEPSLAGTDHVAAGGDSAAQEAADAEDVDDAMAAADTDGAETAAAASADGQGGSLAEASAAKPSAAGKARKTGPGAVSKNGRRSVSSAKPKRRTTRTAPVPPFVSKIDDSTPPTAAAQAVPPPSPTPEALVTPSETDDPLIAEAKRVAAQALGKKSLIGSQEQVCTRSGSVAAGGSPRKSGTVASPKKPEEKKPFSWIYGSEEEAASGS